MAMEFSVGSCIKFGWETFKKRGWFFVGVSVVIMLVGWAIGFLSGFMESFMTSAGTANLGHVLGFIVSYGLQTLLGMGTIAFYLKAYDSLEAASLGDLWHPKDYIIYLAATVFVSVVIMIGFILLIVPGVIFMLMLFFTTYLVVDKGRGPIDAMKESARIAKGHKWQLLLLFLAILGINILGVLCLLVGLLVTIPLTSLAIVHAYRSLEHKANEVAPAMSAA